MARPRTEIGTWGVIHTTEIRPKAKGKPAVWEARARFRMKTGKMRRCRKRGATESKAINALKKHMANLGAEVTGTVSGQTRFIQLIDLWIAEITHKVEKLGTLAPKTLYDYRDTVNNHIRPQLGELSNNELSVAACDERLKKVHAETGLAAAKRTKVVLSNICAFGLRRDATFSGGQSINPVKHVEALSSNGKTKEPIKILEPEDRLDFLTKLRAEVKRQVETSKYSLGPRATAWTDLPDISEAMLSAAVRLGEVLATVGDDIDLENRLLYVGFHLVRVEKVGMVRMPGRKGNEPPLVFKVPPWSIPMWRRRKLAAGPDGPLFPSWNGEWVDVSNVTKRYRIACDAIGYKDISSHVMRHTNGTHLGDNGASLSEIADQLGNTEKVAEQFYRRKRIANESTAALLDNMFDRSPSES